MSTIRLRKIVQWLKNTECPFLCAGHISNAAGPAKTAPNRIYSPRLSTAG